MLHMKDYVEVKAQISFHICFC